ncbi:hypothetical protein GALMADRAFT_420785 [Galerina marginata CBS 339.88]|uniref:Uncharacterized protein n=1 Tax=Galerina marginata (strain CBS 339.88) TaxID=685588 RepID=A0A067T1H9_GALM3|nr:hypothetical protein GALMADRAFT_420785 [Galerina marginata CBS 339.88]
MPALHSKVPTLSLLPSLEGPKQSTTPSEREINRGSLVDVAPDREDLLTSNKSIEEIRQALKLRVNSAYGHWLYRTQKRREVKIRDATTRLSVFGRLGDDPLNGQPEVDSSKARSSNVIRRVLSVSSINNGTNSASNVGTDDGLFSIWGSQSLSTTESLISPRPLGPTHILVVYATQPPMFAALSERHYGVDTIRPMRRKANTAPTFPEVVELPINDLLFVLNVPNLMPPDEFPSLSTLPRRLHKEMPKVLLHVPHLETFPELVIYLHTKNQAALFRSVIPEWMRDLMHPLPQMPSLNTTGNGTPTGAGSNGSFTPFEGLKVKKLLGKLVAGSTSTSSVDTISSTTTSSSAFAATEYSRSFDSIGLEIAGAASEFDVEEDSLLSTAALLEALRDNLNQIGYYAKGLWNELDASREILRQAICHQARVIDRVE